MNEHIPHIAVVGKSETGKTSLVTKLIEKLTTEGYRVGSIKHTRGDFTIDTEGTDTWKHVKSGSQITVFSTPAETSYIFKKKSSLDQMLEKIDDFENFDIVIIEGMKEADIPRISTDEEIEGDIRFENNLEEVIEWVKKEIDIQKILRLLPDLNCKKCGYGSCYAFAKGVYKDEVEIDDCKKLKEKIIQVMVNGEEIPLGHFPAKIMKNSITGMIKSLKGVEEIEDVEIKFSK